MFDPRLETAARQAQEDASYYAWAAQRALLIGDSDALRNEARFYQEEAAYFAEVARNAMGLCDAA